MTEDILEIERLTAGYVRGLPILKDVSLKLARESVTVIIGPNGAGKSTLIKAIAGIVRVTSGTIMLRGKDISGILPHEMAKHSIAYVPQSDNVFRTLSIIKNLELVLKNSRESTSQRIEELFSQFPIIREKQKEKAGSLSGGQRQILAVAMALCNRPEIILMDEPSAGLSPKAAQGVLEFARALTREGVSILLVEQNVNQALRLSDYCYILAEGKNQLDGMASELLEDPIVGQIYLGGKRVVET
ncbi:MAG: ABC transporter ATP-binding protein [Desulfofustis sp.]|nr:ABC transporter ATP-binding protein [Desulfofustis sp.]MBT8352897.1 ABC transporter ATP-binding protein [Desulfofustis sp.]